MNITLKEVKGRCGLSKFIHWPEKLYKGSPYWVPSLVADEFDTFNPKKNAAYEFCESKLWLAYDESGKIVGRVAGIINNKANSIWNKKNVRFGWIDFINDIDVVKALTDAVAQWGREKGMTHIIGPLGFTDMDKEGLMVDGFDKIASFTTIYNYEYYGPLLEQCGFSKDCDWTQHLIHVPEKMERLERVNDMIRKRYGLHCVVEKDVKTLAKKYGKPLFHMYNETFAPLYEFTPLSDRQIDGYIKTFAPIFDMDFMAVLANEKEEMIGFAFCCPSLSKAAQKCKGRMLPFGFIPFLRALKVNDTLEAIMIGVLPEYQGKGAFVPLFKYIHDGLTKRGIKTMITNPQLEQNNKVQSLWDDFAPEHYMRRRSYIKEL